MWYFRASMKGDMDAFQALIDYYKLHDVPNDIDVFKYFTKKFNEGDADAAYILGKLYELGVGTDFDPKKAFNMYN